MPADDVLLRLKTALSERYGSRLARVVLYGSRARGDHGPESDYDVAVFLRGELSFWDEAGALADIEVRVLDETGALVHALPFRDTAYHDRTAFMGEVRRDGHAI